MPRFFVPQVPLHVIQRGNDRRAIFVTPDDWSFFREQLKRAACRHAVAVHAYVLMTNHIHLLATPESPDSLPRMMQTLGRNYVQWFNTRGQRTGTLWEGRYKAAIVDDERYLFTCMRYIELNPVRASAVASVGAYRWSSFRSNALGESDELVAPHPMYVGLGATPGERQAAYRGLFREIVPDEDLRAIRDATQNAWAVGGDAFRASIDTRGRRSARLRRGRPKPPTGNDGKSRDHR